MSIYSNIKKKFGKKILKICKNEYDVRGLDKKIVWHARSASISTDKLSV